MTQAARPPSQRAQPKSGAAPVAETSRPRTRRERHEKVAISVPSSLLRAAREMVATGEAPSISAVFTRALEREFEQENAFEHLVERMVADGELAITDDDRAWARQVLAP